MAISQPHMLGISGIAFILIVVVLAVVIAFLTVVIPCKIFAKAGYSGAMGLLMFIPVANIIALCVLAFGDWPIHRELRQLQLRAGIIGGGRYR